MLEPSARYSAGGVGGGGGGAGGGGHALQIDTHHHSGGLETAVDLSRKVTSETVVGGPGDLDADQDDSEDEAPLDLKVRPRTGSCSSSISVGGGGKPLYLSDIQRAEQSMPNLQQRAELMRIAEAMHTTSNHPPRGLPLPPNIRSSSQEREFPSESACSLCGADTQSPEFRPSDHGENLCGRGTISCPLCAKTFSLWSHYEAHKKCHQKLKQRQYPCQTCGKVFTSASNRNMHQRIHKGVRPFQCTPCGVFFRQKAHLQKHQKTQGHIQATEIYEKKKRDGLINEDTNSSSEGSSSLKKGGGLSSPLSQMRPESVNSNESSTASTASSLPLLADSTSKSPTSADSSFSPRVKSSPKRKQAKPSQLLVENNNGSNISNIIDETASIIKEEMESDCRVSTSDDKVNAFIDYNDLSHGYDCTQCVFASHDLAVLKDHVREEHLALEGEDKLKCRDCQITFSKEFNLRIHNRKHETSSQFLPCDHCEQVFKVPNKLIKHMEGVHAVCPTCGDRQEDKASLLRHLEDAHGEARSKGFHPNLMQFTPLMSHLSSPKLSLENRMAKKRKVDSLAEVIRQKQEMKSSLVKTEVSPNSSSTSLSPPGPATPPPLALRNRKPLAVMRSPMPPSSISEAISASLLHLQPQPRSKLLGGHQDHSGLLHHHRRSENNNVFSMANHLKLPPSIQLPTKPVAGMTPPSSPPPHHQIRGEVSVTIVGRGDSDRDDSDNEAEPAGLDLSIGKRRNSDEHEVTTSGGHGLGGHHQHHLSDLYSRLPLPPPHHAAFPFPFLPPLHPGADPTLAEHLLKLAGLQHSRGGLLSHPPPDVLPKIPTTSPYTVLSAMLGHHTPLYPTVFPGMPPVFPTTPNPIPQATPSPVATATSMKDEPSPPRPSSEFGHLSSASLESHMDHINSGETGKHACRSCGKSFSSKSNLTAHKKIHSGERPFECLVCHKRFRQKAHLQKHETTHSSATPYQCNVCDKAFGHISNLNTHMATHSNVRPYQCGDCGKSYKDSASFKRHRLGHTGERPYNCDLCDESFIDSKSVRRHRELSHPNDPKLPNTHYDDEEEEVDDDEDQAMPLANDTPSTSAYSSFESKDEEIEVEKEMDDDEDEDGLDVGNEADLDTS
jgi:uncharacterized Zn-finger protein